MKTDYGKKIKELRLRRGWTLKQLGDAIGKTAAYISIIENKRPNVRRPLLEDIARALEVDLSYFIGKEKSIPEKPRILRELQALIERHGGVTTGGKKGPRQLPVLSDIAAGKPFPRDDRHPVGVADVYIEAPSDINDPHAFCLRITGDSMEPRLQNGDIVIVCPSWKVLENKPVVVKVRGDEVACKVFSRTDKMVVLTSLNQKYPPQIYSQKEIVWIYPIARAISNLYK